MLKKSLLILLCCAVAMFNITGIGEVPAKQVDLKINNLELLYAEQEEAEYQRLTHLYANDCLNSKDLQMRSYCLNIYRILQSKAENIKTSSNGKRIPLGHEVLKYKNADWDWSRV